MLLFAIVIAVGIFLMLKKKKPKNSNADVKTDFEARDFYDPNIPVMPENRTNYSTKLENREDFDSDMKDLVS